MIDDKNIHSKLLNEAAKRGLKPLGLVQKGRSRTWLDDRNWFVIVVDFEPSSWSRGSYLSVSCNWLWMVKSSFSSDEGGRLAPFEFFTGFHDVTQFAVASEKMAQAAAKEVVRYRSFFPSVRSVCDYYLPQSSENIWTNFHAAIACALSGEHAEAGWFFTKVLKSTHDTEWAATARLDAAHLQALSQDHDAFREVIVERVKQSRTLKRLPNVQDIVL